MDTYTIIGIAFVTLTGCLGLGLGLRLLRIGRRTRTNVRSAYEDDTAQARIAQDELMRRCLAQPRGARRRTPIHGITSNGLLRHTDGSYTKAYLVEMETTLYAEDGTVDRNYNELARALTSIKQSGIVVQLRHAAHPDAGAAIKRQLEAQVGKETFFPARMLHTMGVAEMEAQARERNFQRAALTCWIRVPARHANDPSRARLTAFTLFFPALAKELRRQGIARFISAIGSSWKRVNHDRLTARTLTDETECREQAEQTFAQIEHTMPFRIRAFSRDEMWRAVYFGHRMNEESAPELPRLDGADLRLPLCAEEIKGDGEFLLHGRTPVALVSLFRPPTPVITADAMRMLTANANLVFDHTTITEFITLDQERAKRDLKATGKSLILAQSAASRRSPDPEAEDPDASAARTDIKNLRASLSGGRAALIEARCYTIVFGRAVRNKEELRASIEELDRNCRHITTAYGKFPGADAGREQPEALRALITNRFPVNSTRAALEERSKKPHTHWRDSRL